MKTRTKVSVKMHEIIVLFYSKIATKIKGCKTLAWAAYKDSIKCKLAANNGDTLVEAVISTKRTNSDYDNENNSNSKTTRKLFKHHH